MAQDTLTQMFDLVAARREPGIIFATYSPLPKEQVATLKGLLTTALTEDKATKDMKFREKLLQAQGAIGRYEEMPDTVTLRVSSGVAGPDGRRDTLNDPGVLRDFRNGAKDKVIVDMQKKLYKALKR